MTAPTLTEALAARGYTHRPAAHGSRDILDRTGAVVFTGRAHEVWAWLRSTLDDRVLGHLRRGRTDPGVIWQHEHDAPRIADVVASLERLEVAGLALRAGDGWGVAHAR